MEHTEYKISHYSLIRERRIILNGNKIIEEGEGADFPAFLSSVYKTFATEYAKFYKMDLLSKLGMLTAEFLVDSGKVLTPYRREAIAVVISNSQSSLESDHHYHESMADPANYYPNPGLFVYTLPNIMIGEIGIKFDLKGENLFLVFPSPDFKTLHSYAEYLLRETETDVVLTGWVDLDIGYNYNAILFLVEKTGSTGEVANTWEFTPKSMEDLYFEKNLEDNE